MSHDFKDMPKVEEANPVVDVKDARTHEKLTVTIRTLFYKDGTSTDYLILRDTRDASVRNVFRLNSLHPVDPKQWERIIATTPEQFQTKN